MLIYLSMILAPCVVFVLTLQFSKRLKPGLRKAYLALGGIVVFLGGATSIYFALNTGDQGGIAAFYFQLLVIMVYVALTLSLIIINWSLRMRDTEKTELDDGYIPPDL